MSTVHLVPEWVTERFSIHEYRNAVGILQTACAEEWDDILAVLRDYRPTISQFAKPGGSKSLMAGQIDGALYAAIGKSYTATSTWLSKLSPRIDGGVAGGCPILVFGIKPAAFVDDMTLDLPAAD